MIALHLKRLLSIKGLLLYYALILCLFLLLTSIFNNYTSSLTRSDQIKLGVVSEDKHQLSQILLDSFKNSPQFTALFQLSFDTLENTTRAFEKGTLDAYVVIPSGFTEGLLTYENQDIELYGHLENPLKNQLIASILSGYASYIDASNAATWSLYFTMKDAKLPTSDILKINSAFSFEMIGATLGRSNYFSFNPVSELPMLSATSYFILALPMGFITLTTLSGGTQCIVNRKRAVYGRLSIASRPFIKQLLAEHIAQWLHGILLLLPVFFGIYWYLPGQFPIATSLLILFWWFWQCVWRLASYATDNPNTFVMTASSIAFLVVLSSGGFVPYLMLPDWLKSLGSWLPNFKALQWASQNHPPATQLAVVLGFVALIFLSIVIESRIALKPTFSATGGDL